MDGLLLFNKPILWTSHDAVDFFRRRLGQRRIGHGGTLDPLATGLLLVLVGEATRWSARLSGLDKDYAGSFTLGIRTDTQDLEGRYLAETDPGPQDHGSVADVLRQMRGRMEQLPPAFSAVRQAGKKLYQHARSGAAVEAKPRPVEVTEFELVRFEWPEAYFFLSCSKGTYVRSLCDEAGRRLGCGATLSSLTRLRVGPYRLADALDERTVRESTNAEIERRLLGEP